MALKSMRNVHANAVKICDSLKLFADSWKLKTDGFAEKTDGLELDIDSAAMHRGLSRLPDDLLVDILDRTAYSLVSSVQLSHVCKRFRRTLACLSEHWTGHILDSNMPPSVIFSIIERGSVGPFEAIINFRHRVGPTSDSVRAIMNLGARLHDLTIVDKENAMPPLSYPEQGHALSPRTLTACYCLPHPSLLRNVVDCSLVLWQRHTLKDLLDFLSSADKFEVLVLSPYYHFIDRDNAGSLAPICLPSLTTLRFDVKRTGLEACLQFMKKIVPFTISSLGFTLDSRTDIGPLLDFIHTRPSVQELRLLTETRSSYYSLPPIPRQIERLELSQGYATGLIATWLRSSEVLPAQSLHFLKLNDCSVYPRDILRLGNLFVRTGCDQVRFEFNNCGPMKNGVYELADVDKAFP